MQKTQAPLNKPAVELTLEQLQSVAGGLPRGGWGQEGDPVAEEAVTAAASVQVDPTPLPRGGW